MLAVDDEAPARAQIARFLASDPRFVLAGEATNGLEALRALEAIAPDVVVLDVKMPRMGGLEVLEALEPERRPVIIFATAFDAHAVRAFDANAVDYLLKPYDRARFARALDKAWAQLSFGELAQRNAASLASAVQTALQAQPRTRLALRTASGWVSVALDELVRISAAGKHVHVFAGGAPLIVRQTLATILARLDPHRFVRVHRSEIVNVEAVASVEPWTHGDAILVLRDGSSLVLSRTYRRAFLERLRA